MKPAKEGKNVTLSEARAVFREISRQAKILNRPLTELGRTQVSKEVAGAHPLKEGKTPARKASKTFLKAR